jgi:hypothetical protein
MVSQFTQIPWLDQVWNKNAFVSMFRGPTGFSILGIVGKFVAERQAKKGNGKTVDDGLRERDMLDMFLDIQSNNALPQWYVPSFPAFHYTIHRWEEHTESSLGP